MRKPESLGLRGSQLWDTVTEATEFDAAGYVLLEDACRTADIIQDLSDLLASDEADWIAIVEKALGKSDREKRVVLNVHPLLGEIRQQRLALRQLFNQLGVAGVSGGEEGGDKATKAFWARMEEEVKKG